MGAYNWIVLLMCIGFVGLLYAASYDAVKEIQKDAYVETTEAQLAVNIIWKCWQFLPVCCLVGCIVYGILSGSKGGSL